MCVCYFQLPQHRSISGWQAHTLTCLNLVFPFVCTPATLCTMSPRTFFFSSALLIKITMPPSSSSLLGLPSSCHLPCIAKLLRLHSPLFPRPSIFVSLDPLLFICFVKRNKFDSRLLGLPPAVMFAISARTTRIILHLQPWQSNCQGLANS